MLSTFHMLIHLYFFFGVVSVQICCPFFNWVVFLLLSFKNSLSILDTSPLFEKYFYKDFLPVCDLSFHSLNSVWYLILCVTLTGPRDDQIVGKTLFLDVSVRLFLEEISLRRWPLPMWAGVIQSTKSMSRTKRQRKGEVAFCWSCDICFLLPSHTGPPGS